MPASTTSPACPWLWLLLWQPFNEGNEHNRTSQFSPLIFPLRAIAPASRRQDLTSTCPCCQVWKHSTCCTRQPCTSQVHPNSVAAQHNLARHTYQKQKNTMGRSLLGEGGPRRLHISPQRALGCAVRTLSSWVPLDRWALTSRAGHRTQNRCYEFWGFAFFIKRRKSIWSVVLWGHLMISRTARK